MNQDQHLATKAQALAVREYLATLGVTISHVQALEVLARGQGMRSRHLLAQQNATEPLTVTAGGAHAPLGVAIALVAAREIRRC